MRDARLLRALALVDDARPFLEPAWDPYERCGYTYRSPKPAPGDEHLRDDLEILADASYVERVFIERLSVCPNCSSHDVNVHEACVSCGSSHLVQFKALFHFRCGFVGPTTAFKPEPKGLRCPKCNKLLNDLGTDHDSPGEYFRCRGCAAIFQTPEMGARCVSCSARFRRADLGQIEHRDVFAYRMSALGRAALREGRLFEDLGEVLRADAMLEPRHRIVERLTQLRSVEAAKPQRYALIAIRLPAADASSDIANVTDAVKAAGDVTLGRLDQTHLIAVVAGRAEREAPVLRDRLEATGVRAAIFELGETEEIEAALEIASRGLDRD